MKQGFTLLELLIVIVIVAILATLGMTQYSAVIERSRGAEARQILGQLRSVCAGLFMQDGNTTRCTDSGLNIDASAASTDTIPGACRASHYFSYNATSVAAGDSGQFIATRCTTGNGKSPGASTARTVQLTTDYKTGGIDTWVNTFGY